MWGLFFPRQQQAPGGNAGGRGGGLERGGGTSAWQQLVYRNNAGNEAASATGSCWGLLQHAEPVGCREGECDR